MKQIDVGGIKVSPFEFDSILEMRIEKKLNEHETLYVCGIVKEDQQLSPVTDMEAGTRIVCENGGQAYFKGVLQSVKIKRRDNLHYLEVSAISNTVLLDTVKYKRSFQDNSQTYKSIVETVIKDNGASAIFNAPETTVENIILQYDETDWEFAKRLASHTRDVLIPVVGDEPSFYFGATDKGGAKLETNNFDISKEFVRIQSEGGTQKIEEILICVVETDEFICELGEGLTLNGTDYFVRKVSIAYVNSVLTITYTLSDKTAISTHKYYNPAIIGLVLDGTVLEVENDKLKLHLVIDDEQDVGLAHLFKYATGYSMESHTGWYVMPEVGDTVQLLFPTEDEKYAYAASSVRRDDTERTEDHLVKYLRTSFGKEIKFDKNEILISALDDVTYIRVNEDENKGIEIITPHPILVRSDSTMNIESKDDMTVTTEKNLFIQAKDSIKMVNAGNVMSFVTDAGISASTDKKLNVSSEDNVSVTGSKEIRASAKENMRFDSGSKLIASADASIELAGNTSEMILQGSGIDINAIEIRESC